MDEALNGCLFNLKGLTVGKVGICIQVLKSGYNMMLPANYSVINYFC